MSKLLSERYRQFVGLMPLRLKLALKNNTLYSGLLKPVWAQGLRFCQKRLSEFATSSVVPIIINQRSWPGPLVSIIVTCYNYGDFLDPVLACLKAQSERNFEIILIDDGSTDPETVAKVNELKKLESPDFTVMQQPNQGVIAARNNAIAKAQGKYIFPLDADDTIEKTFLQKCLLFLENSPEHFFVYTWTHSTGDKDFVWETRDSDPDYSLIENRMGYVMFRKSAFMQVGGYNPVMAAGYEDWELCVNLVAHGYIGRVIKEPLYNYYVKPGARNYHAIKKHEILKTIINDLHRASTTINRKILLKLAGQSYCVKDSLINFSTSEKAGFREKVFLLDLYSSGTDVCTIMDDLRVAVENLNATVLLTLPAPWKDLFLNSCPENLFVYYPELYHPSRDIKPFYDYLERRYQPQPLSLGELQSYTNAG